MTDPTCICCCRPKSEHVRKQCPETTYFVENVAALSPQTLPAPGEVGRMRKALADHAEAEEVSRALVMKHNDDFSAEAEGILANARDRVAKAREAITNMVITNSAPILTALATVAAANDEGVAEALDRQVRIAAWNAAKKSGATDALGYAVVEAVVAEFAAIRLLSQGGGK